ncbi:Talin-1 [Phlyctochytrium bullatum]|nr:Talin-1 [Phlyctochytrium bullatum]
MSANASRAGYLRTSTYVQSSQLKSPTAYAQTAEISGAQQSLSQSIRNGLAVVLSSSADLEVGIQLPPLGNDQASLQWRQQTIDTNSESVASQLASHLASIGSLINHATGNIETMDYELLNSGLNIITSNLSHMSNGLKMLSALTDDVADKESLLEAARNFGKATANFLESIQPIIMGQPSKDQMYSTARDVAVMASDLLTFIGRLEVSEESQNELVDAARSVARSVADLVGAAKKVADTMKDQPEQLAVAANAKAIAEAANQLVACTTVVSPTITIQICLDQLMESSVLIKDGLSRLAESSSPCTNARFTQYLKDSIQKVEEAIAKLLDRANKCSVSNDTDPLDDDYQHVISSIDFMLKNLDTTEGIVASAKDLTLSATQFVNSLKRAGLERNEGSERDRLLSSAKLLADATSRMVAAAKDVARYPGDVEKRSKLEKAAKDLQAVSASACGPQLQFNALQRLNKALKDSVASQNQLIIAARNAASSNRNQASQIQLNVAMKKVTDFNQTLALAVKAHSSNSNDVVSQCNLISAAKQLIPALSNLVNAAKTAAPTAGETALQSHLQNLAQLAENDLLSLDTACRVADELSSGLRLESALYTAEAIQLDLDGSGQGLARLSVSSRMQASEVVSVEIAHSQLISNAKEIQQSISLIASATLEKNERSAGIAASEAVSALQSIVQSATALKSAEIDDDLKSSVQLAANNVAHTLASLISAAKSTVQEDFESNSDTIKLLTDSALSAVGQIVLCLPGQRDLDNALHSIQAEVQSFITKKYEKETPKTELYTVAQTRLQASANALAMAANALSAAVRGGLIELQNGATTFGASFGKLIRATEKFSDACGDDEVRQKLVTAVEKIGMSSSVLVNSAKASAGDMSNISFRNEILSAVRLLGDSLNSLIDVCSASAPGHTDCNNALRILTSASGRVDAISEGTLTSISFSESVSNLSENGKLLCSILNGALAAARAGNVLKMAQDLLVAAQTVLPLTENAVRAGYLIGVADESSVPAVPPIVDQTEITHASYDVKDAMKKLIEPTNTQQQILEIAANIAKNTSRICNICKTAGTNPALSHQSRQIFISSAKDVAVKTSAVVAVIKQLAVSLDEPSRTKAEETCGPLIEAIDQVVQVAMSSEFAGVPAKFSPAALSLQKPILELIRSIISSVQDVVNSAKLVCSNAKDQTALQLMSTEIKDVTDTTQSLISTTISSAPGQKECNEAIQKVSDNIGLLDAAIMDATVNNLSPSPGVQKEALVEACKALASLIDVIARSATCDLGGLAAAVLELPGQFKQVFSVNLI